ncbi:MAG TPA: fluoride efflux transporter CrcB [Planctomycetes bacterium]|nr:fluoride efflux transporter CrcB [Fuerstiella sp.]HIK95628.1 fluoride efflux transporter CrcB [Planctomycetota bacterium]
MSDLTIPVAIGLGGFVGAVARFYVSSGVAKACGEDLAFLGTLSVNLIGCFAIGILATIATRANVFSPLVQTCLITGLLGSLTTFSTFAFESLSLMQTGRLGAAVLNMSANLLAGLVLAWLGIQVAGLFLSDVSANG